jgi:hypothetical protein
MEDTNRIVCSRKFWTYTARPLPELAEALLKSGVVSSANHDCENVYEWLECRLSRSSIELNISRKHHDGDIDDTEPLAFLLIGNDATVMDEIVDEVAGQIASVLQMPMTLGAIEYLGGDDYRYNPDKSRTET